MNTINVIVLEMNYVSQKNMKLLTLVPFVMALLIVVLLFVLIEIPKRMEKDALKIVVLLLMLIYGTIKGVDLAGSE